MGFEPTGQGKYSTKGGGIIAALNNYPNLSQRAVAVNGDFDCVPTSVDDGLEYLTGKQFNVYDIVTAAYGPNYHGFTGARAFVDFCAKQGVRLYPIDGDNATLVQDMHQHIQLGHPCLLTEPDPYAPLHPDWTHVLSVYREDPGSLTARDPFSTHDVTHTDAQWASLLEFREIWVMERIQSQEDQPMPITINSPQASGFKELDASHWQCISNGHIIQFGLLADYKLRGYSFLGMPWSNEITLSSGHAIQWYQYGVRQWLNGVVSSVDLYNDGIGTDPRLVSARQQIQQLQAQLAQQPTSQAQATLDKIKLDVPQAQAGLDKIKADLAGA